VSVAKLREKGREKGGGRREKGNLHEWQLDMSKKIASAPWHTREELTQLKTQTEWYSMSNAKWFLLLYVLVAVNTGDLGSRSSVVCGAHRPRSWRSWS